MIKPKHTDVHKVKIILLNTAWKENNIKSEYAYTPIITHAKVKAGLLLVLHLKTVHIVQNKVLCKDACKSPRL